VVVSKQWPAEVAPTLNAHFGSKQGLEDQHALGGAGHFVPVVAKIITRGEGFRYDFETCNLLPFDTTQMTSKANRSHPHPGDPCHPLAAGAHPPAVAIAVPIDLRNAQRDPEKHDAVNRQGTGIAKDGDPAHTLSAASVHGVATGMQVRRLTPIECERLQGFPDGYTDIRPRGKDTPDGPRYKALGNSMAVPVMRWIGERIAKVEDISEG